MHRPDLFAAASAALWIAVATASGGPVRADDPPASSPATLEEAEKPFEPLEKAAAKETRRREFDAVLAYVTAHPRAKDLEEARWHLVRLATTMEEWDLAAQRTLEYLTVHPGSSHEVEVLFARAQALGKLARTAEAKAVYETLTKRLSPGTYDKTTVTAAWLHYAACCLDGDDVEGAKSVFRGLKAVFEPRSDGASAVTIADEELAKLEWTGKDAKAFPADAKDLDGKVVSLADFRGKVLLIDFWATWCVPCTKELSNVVAEHAKWHEKGFDVLGVAIDAPTDAAKVRAFVSAHGVAWRQVHYATAARNAVADLYGVHGVPYTILVGRDGKILRVGLRGEALGRFLKRIFP